MMDSPTEPPAAPDRQDRPFSIRIEKLPKAVVVHLAGSCTMEVSQQLGANLVRLASEPQSRIIVDVSRLDFIESRGLGGLVAGHVRSRRNGGEIRLVSPKPDIRHLLEVTRLVQLFQVFDSVDEALSAKPPVASS